MNKDKLYKQIDELFYNNINLNIVFSAENETVDVYVTGEALGWTNGWLNGMIKMRDLLKVKELDMPSHYRTEGCPTCGHGGGTDKWQFHGWN